MKKENEERIADFTKIAFKHILKTITTYDPKVDVWNFGDREKVAKLCVFYAVAIEHELNDHFSKPPPPPVVASSMEPERKLAEEQAVRFAVVKKENLN